MTKQWNKLPTGTRLVDDTHGRMILLRQDDDYGAPGEFIGVQNEDGTGGIWGISEFERGDHNVRIDPAEFADAYRRDELAKIGFFSIDDAAHRRRRELEECHAKTTNAAYAVLGLDRDAALNRVAGILDDARTDGIWATSTIEYAKKREALDNAVRYAAGVTTHA